jgi:hypothetical protein
MALGRIGFNAQIGGASGTHALFHAQVNTLLWYGGPRFLSGLKPNMLAYFIAGNPDDVIWQRGSHAWWYPSAACIGVRASAGTGGHGSAAIISLMYAQAANLVEAVKQLPRPCSRYWLVPGNSRLLGALSKSPSTKVMISRAAGLNVRTERVETPLRQERKGADRFTNLSELVTACTV